MDVRIRAAVALLLCLAVPAAGHVPSFEGAGRDAEHALRIPDGDKSRVYYDQLDGDVQWYQWDAGEGDLIYVGINTPPGEALPDAWLIGPGLPAGEGPPGTPDGLGVVPLQGDGDVGLEPFSPAAMRDGGEAELPAPASGTYYVAVQGSGDYSVAVGKRESFTPTEWATVPWQRIAIQDWVGIAWPLVIAGEVLGMAGAVWWWRRSGGRSVRGHVGAAGTGLIAGSAVSVLLLLGLNMRWSGWSGAAFIPIVFAAAAAGIGYLAWRGLRSGRRIMGAGAAALGIVAWSGLLIGPALLLAWAAWPSREVIAKWRGTRSET